MAVAVDDDAVAALRALGASPRDVGFDGEWLLLRGFLRSLEGLPATVTRSDYGAMRSQPTPARCTPALKARWSGDLLDLQVVSLRWSALRAWRAWRRQDGLLPIGLGVAIDARSGRWTVEADTTDVALIASAMTAAAGA